MKMSMHFLILLLLLAKANSNFEISLWPSSQVYVIPEHTSSVFACQADLYVGSFTNVIMQWRGPYQSDRNLSRNINDSIGIPNLKEKLFVAKDTLTISLLYLSNLESQDSGEYSCKVLVDGKEKEKSINLIVSSSLSYEKITESILRENKSTEKFHGHVSTTSNQSTSDTGIYMPSIEEFIIWDLWNQTKNVFLAKPQEASKQEQSQNRLTSRILPINWF